jgi:gluconate kinase
MFGKSGAGKGYVGAVCVEELGFTLYEGDRDLTPSMKQAIAEQRPFTPAMRADFARVLACNVHRAWNELKLAKPRSPGLVVCQGLFKERERRWLSQRFPEACWLWVRASAERLHARLEQRIGHVASAAYAELVNAGFEPPQLVHQVLDNDGDRALVVQQLKALS